TFDWKIAGSIFPLPTRIRMSLSKALNPPLLLFLTNDGKAAKGGIAVGDVVLSIDGISTDGMNHLEAQNKIKNCSSNLNFLFVFHRAPRKHIVDTDIHFYHVPSHGDASRKRITEDTEDWRPHAGTTQSRSFRILAQITGTESGRNSQAHLDIEIFSLTRLEVVNNTRLVVGPKYNELKNWHHEVSARTLNVQ
uniref:PDZ and LIM domain 5a n=1 Tax=Oryzias sinensis TaxID=183150 RepID=A0A8C7XSR4_9TELE